MGLAFVAVICLLVFLKQITLSGQTDRQSGAHSKQAKESDRITNGESDLQTLQPRAPRRENTFSQGLIELQKATTVPAKRVSLNRLIADYGVSNPEDVLKVILSHSPPEFQPHDLLRFFQILSNTGNVEKGAELLDTLDPGSIRSATIKGFWMAIGNIPEDLFMKYYETAAFQEDRSAMLDALKRTQPKNEDLLREVVKGAENLDSGFIQKQLLLKDTANVGVSGIHDAIAVIDDGNDPRAQRLLWDYYLTRMAQIHDPSEVAAALETKRELLGDSRVNESFRRLISLAFNRSPQEATLLLDSAQDPELRQNAIGQITNHWLERNSIEASNWVSSLESPQDKKIGMERIIEFLRRTGDEQSADAWQKQLDLLR